jgi:hypothetical protein
LYPGTAALRPGRFGPGGFLLWSVDGVGGGAMGRGVRRGLLLYVRAMCCIVLVAGGLGLNRGRARMQYIRHECRRYTLYEAGLLFES